MRGTIAKRIRKQIYGEDYSPRYRKYTMRERFLDEVKNLRMWANVHADDRRQRYQQAKRAYLRG